MEFDNQYESCIITALTTLYPHITLWLITTNMYYYQNEYEIDLYV